MDHYAYRDGELYCDGTSLRAIAEGVGTPTYVYSARGILEAVSAYDRALASLPHLIAYSVKDNSNLSVLALLARAGAGADVISGGELFRALKAGFPPKKITFAGPGKTRDEMVEALKADILLFNVESPAELRQLDRVAQWMGVRASVAIRINPDVDPRTHPYVSTGLKTAKFGIPINRALEEYRAARGLSGIDPVGVHMHIGSQLTTIAPVAEAVSRAARFVSELRSAGIPVRYLDVGGGLGIRYKDELPPTPGEYADALLPMVKDLGVTLILEPGRSIVGSAGVLLTRVLYVKDNGEKRFVIVDAAMNDLIRPSLYNAYHEIVPVVQTRGRPTSIVDVVGPICESGDFLAQDRELPAVEEGELLAVMSAGAFGFVMSSNYNARPRAAEVLVKGDSFALVRRRETYEDLISGEQIPEEEEQL